jgi:hypothetical protein
VVADEPQPLPTPIVATHLEDTIGAYIADYASRSATADAVRGNEAMARIREHFRTNESADHVRAHDSAEPVRANESADPVRAHDSADPVSANKSADPVRANDSADTVRANEPAYAPVERRGLMVTPTLKSERRLPDALYNPAPTVPHLRANAAEFPSECDFLIDQHIQGPDGRLYMEDTEVAHAVKDCTRALGAYMPLPAPYDPCNYKYFTLVTCDGYPKVTRLIIIINK